MIRVLLFYILLQPRVCVSLTYDDGPRVGVTDRLLDTLFLYGVKATFFPISEWWRGGARDLVIREIRAGHEVGLHSVHHDWACYKNGRGCNRVEYKAWIKREWVRPWVKLRELYRLYGEDRDRIWIRFPWCKWNSHVNRFRGSIGGVLAPCGRNWDLKRVGVKREVEGIKWTIRRAIQAVKRCNSDQRTSADLKYCDGLLWENDRWMWRGWGLIRQGIGYRAVVVIMKHDQRRGVVKVTREVLKWWRGHKVIDGVGVEFSTLTGCLL